MVNAYYIKDPVSLEKEIILVSDWSTPNDIVKIFGFDPNAKPTICMILRKGFEPLFLGRDEWDDKVLQGYDCYFISYPKEGATIVAVISLVISMALTVYSLLQKPDIPDSQKRLEQGSTYRLNGLRNEERLDQPIPVQYGRLRIYPDVASRFYAKMESNNEWLYGRLCIGWGEFEVDENEIKVDDTPLANFRDASNFAVLNPGDAPTIFLNDVETAQDIANIELDYEEDEEEVVIPLGPFVVNKSGTEISKIDLDFEMRQGLYTSDTDGALSTNSVTIYAQAQKIDDSGNAIGSWMTAKEISHSAATYDVQRFTATLDGETHFDGVGRYQVRLYLSEAPDEGSYNQNGVTLVRLKGYSSTEIAASLDKTYFEFKVRASEQFNSSNSNILNLVAHRKILHYVDGDPEFGINSSPVWAFYDLATNPDYGAGLDLTRVNLSELIEIDANLSNDLLTNEPPIECNVRFETSASALDLLGQLAQTARAQVYQRAGRIWMVRDQYSQAITGFFTPDNIAKGSFNISGKPRSKLSPNYIELTYFDEVTWQQETVLAVWPGEEPLIKEDIKILAITNRQRAYQEAMYYLSQDRLRRQEISFETDVEGLLPTLMSRISISHYSLSNHTSGVIEDVVNGELHLSDPLDFGDFGYGFMRFKNLDGDTSDAIIVARGSTPYIAIPVSEAFTRDDFIVSKYCSNTEPTTFSFGLTTGSVIGIIKSIQPQDMNTVSIGCVVDDPRVYSLSRDYTKAPALGELYTPQDAFIFKNVVAQVDAGTNMVTVEWDGWVYDKYKIVFIYNIDNAIETTTVTQDADETEENVLAHEPEYAGSFPVAVYIIPIVIIDTEDIEYAELKTFARMILNPC